MHRTHHRDLGLRRISALTRRIALGAVALTGVLTAVVARPQAHKARTATGIAATGLAAGTTVGTLPPDTFPTVPSAGASPTSPATSPTSPTTSPTVAPPASTNPPITAAPPITAPPVATAAPPVVSSGAS